MTTPTQQILQGSSVTITSVPVYVDDVTYNPKPSTMTKQLTSQDQETITLNGVIQTFYPLSIGWPQTSISTGLGNIFPENLNNGWYICAELTSETYTPIPPTQSITAPCSMIVNLSIPASNAKDEPIEYSTCIIYGCSQGGPGGNSDTSNAGDNNGFNNSGDGTNAVPGCTLGSMGAGGYLYQIVLYFLPNQNYVLKFYMYTDAVGGSGTYKPNAGSPYLLLIYTLDNYNSESPTPYIIYIPSGTGDTSAPLSSPNTSALSSITGVVGTSDATGSYAIPFTNQLGITYIENTGTASDLFYFSADINSYVDHINGTSTSPGTMTDSNEMIQQSGYGVDGYAISNPILPQYGGNNFTFVGASGGCASQTNYLSDAYTGGCANIYSPYYPSPYNETTAITGDSSNVGVEITGGGGGFNCNGSYDGIYTNTYWNVPAGKYFCGLGTGGGGGSYTYNQGVSGLGELGVGGQSTCGFFNVFIQA